jgi:putative endonuclease
MYFVYAITSLKKHYIYVGMTKDLLNRIERHNNGREKTTKPYAPFKLLYCEEFDSRVVAREREKYWKSGAGKEKLKKLRNTIT